MLTTRAYRMPAGVSQPGVGSPDKANRWAWAPGALPKTAVAKALLQDCLAPADCWLPAQGPQSRSPKREAAPSLPHMLPMKPPRSSLGPAPPPRSRSPRRSPLQGSGRSSPGWLNSFQPSRSNAMTGTAPSRKQCAPHQPENLGQGWPASKHPPPTPPHDAEVCRPGTMC